MDITIILNYLIRGLSLGSVYAIIALGYTMVYGIAKMLNFAHGDVIMVGGYVCFFAMSGLSGNFAEGSVAATVVPAVAGTLLAMAVCTVLGVVIERLAYKPLRQAPSLAVLITAIGVSYFLQNAALLLWSSNPKVFTPVTGRGSLQVGALSISYVTLLTIAACIIIMVVLTAFTSRTKLGKAMRAVSEDKGAAQLMGINVNATISLTFAIGSALAAIAGVLYMSAYPTLTPTTGSMPGIKHRLHSRGHAGRPAAGRDRDFRRRLHLHPAPERHRLRGAHRGAAGEARRSAGQDGPGESVKGAESMNRILQMKKSTRSSLFTYGLVIGAYLIIQLLRSFREGGVGSVLEGQLVPICAYVTMALALNLVVGVSGELSLGHAGFMSIGAFAGCSVAAALQNSVEMEPLRLALAMVLGGVIAGIFGFLIGVPVLRLNGDYLAIVTLAFGEIIKSLVTNVYLGVDENGLHFSFLSDNTNLSETGVELIRGPVGVTNSARIATFTAGVVLVLVALFVIFNLVNSRTGRAIMAARDNRIAAESVGISVTKYKMIAFVTSAVLAGAAGTLYGCGQVTFTATKFDFNTSILILVFVVLGGLGNMWGSVIAAAALTILPEALRQFADYRMLVYAIVLILVMLATNNPTLWNFIARVREERQEKKEGAKQ